MTSPPSPPGASGKPPLASTIDPEATQILESAADAGAAQHPGVEADDMVTRIMPTPPAAPPAAPAVSHVDIVLDEALRATAPQPAPADAPIASRQSTRPAAPPHPAPPQASPPQPAAPGARGTPPAMAPAPASQPVPPAPPSRPDPVRSLGDGSIPSTPGSSSLPGERLADDAPVRQVGRYLVQQRLGRGGMATVYRAHDPSIGRDVAIKFLHAALSEDEECRTRFLREARAAGGLSHPNIVIVYDVGEIEGRPCMAMELIEGMPLADLLERKKVLPIRDVLVIGLQLARALEYAHGKGVVHRDIKPGNIMLLKDGLTIKVTDFGIAHMDDGAQQLRTQVGAVIGTPQYMSPEQARGEKLDGRSDLFAAGIVLYQMLTGERPFQGDNLVAVAHQIANVEPPSVSARRPEVPAALRRVIECCLQKQPAQRYPSGRELADALRKVLDEFDKQARERAKPRIVPLRVKWALTMAVIVALVMGMTAAVITQRQYAALVQQAGDYGAALARFIAAQNAAAVLGEEWEVVDVAVQEIMKTRNFERITVVDGAGVVRAATQPALIGQPYRAVPGEALEDRLGGVKASRYDGPQGSVLGFEAPVNYRDKQVGWVALGVPERPLTEVARLSITLMAVLVLVTVLAVAAAMYFLANWFAQPIRLVVDSMAELAKGRYAHRIGEKRRDEFGELFVAFDSMALAVQQRAAGVDPVATPAPSNGLQGGTAGPAQAPADGAKLG